MSYGADRGGIVPAGLLKAAEIMGAQKIGGGLVHGFHVQRCPAPPRKAAAEGVFVEVDEIVVSP